MSTQPRVAGYPPPFLPRHRSISPPKPLHRWCCPWRIFIASPETCASYVNEEDGTTRCSTTALDSSTECIGETCKAIECCGEIGCLRRRLRFLHLLSHLAVWRACSIGVLWPICSSDKTLTSPQINGHGSRRLLAYQKPLAKNIILKCRLARRPVSTTSPPRNFQRRRGNVGMADTSTNIMFGAILGCPRICSYLCVRARTLQRRHYAVTWPTTKLKCRKHPLVFGMPYEIIGGSHPCLRHTAGWFLSTVNARNRCEVGRASQTSVRCTRHRADT